MHSTGTSGREGAEQSTPGSLQGGGHSFIEPSLKYDYENDIFDQGGQKKTPKKTPKKTAKKVHFHQNYKVLN